MIEQNRITGTQVCILLIEQDVINPTENQIAELKSGSVSALSLIHISPPIGFIILS